MNILKNKYFILGNILLLLAVIPLTLFVVKRQTDLRSKAAPTTTLAFTPTTASTTTGQTTNFDIMVNPGQNIVSIVELNIAVDPDKLEITALTNNDQAFPVKLKGPTINTDGTATLSISTSNDVQKAIQTTTKVATLTVKAKNPTSGAATIVKFDKAKSQVFSLATSDGATENVLSDTGTASVTITGAGSTSSGVKPVCTAINTDRATTGVAPYAITFTGAGNTTTGTISNVTFNFGDGVSQDIKVGGGIGTNTVSTQISHTYTNPGTYSATAILTDSAGNTSDATTCTKSITISSVLSGGGSSSGSGVASPSATASPSAIALVPTATEGPAPTLPITGSFQTTLAVLGGVAITVMIGAFLFVL